MTVAADPDLALALTGPTVPVRGTALPTLRAAAGIALTGPDAWDRLRLLRASKIRVGAVVVGAGAPPEDRPRLEPVAVVERVDQLADALDTLGDRLATVRLATGAADLDRARFVPDDDRPEVPLTALEVRLVAYLAARAGRAVDRDELQREVWDHRRPVPTKSVDVAIARLRKKIEPDPTRPAAILTVRNGGYRAVTRATAPIPDVGSRMGPLRDRVIAAATALDGPRAAEAAASLAADAAALAAVFDAPELDADLAADLIGPALRTLDPADASAARDRAVAVSAGASAYPRARIALAAARADAVRDPAAARARLAAIDPSALSVDDRVERAVLDARLARWLGAAPTLARDLDRWGLAPVHARVLDAVLVEADLAARALPIEDGCEALAAIARELDALGATADAAGVALMLAPWWSVVAPGRIAPLLDRFAAWSVDPGTSSHLAAALAADHLAAGALDRAWAAAAGIAPSCRADLVRAEIHASAGRLDDARGALRPWIHTFAGTELAAALACLAGRPDEARAAARALIDGARDPRLTARAWLAAAVAAGVSGDRVGARRALALVAVDALPPGQRATWAFVREALGDAPPAEPGPVAAALRRVNAATRPSPRDTAALARSRDPRLEPSVVVRIGARFAAACPR